MNEVYDYIDFHNQTSATIDKLLRIDIRDYPEVALREALLNMLVHRDYSFSSSALISLYADRIKFVSLGELMPGIETTKNAFKIILPNISTKYETGNNNEQVTGLAKSNQNITDDEALIIGYAKSYNFITRNDVIELLDVSTSTASRILQRMVKIGVLKQYGNAIGTRYTAKKSRNHLRIIFLSMLKVKYILFPI